MKISIIIPIYNVSSYIEDCLQSVAQQDYKGDVECLLIDDCGTDDSMAKAGIFVDNYRGNIDFVFLKHECNKGLSEARNTGIQNSTGDYVLFLDSDDSLKPNCLSKLAEPLASRKYDFVFANYEAVCTWSNMNLTLAIPEGPIIGQKAIADSFHWGWHATAWNKLINREFLIRNNLFFKPRLLHEDELWSFNLACVAQSMYVLNERMYIYNVRGIGGTITSDYKSRRHLEAYIDIVKSMYGLLKEHSQSKNSNLIGIAENLKCYCLNLSSSLDSISKSYNLYKSQKALKLISSLGILSNYSFKDKIRFANCLMPDIIGFVYLAFVNNLSGMAVSIRHSIVIRSLRKIKK